MRKKWIYLGPLAVVAIVLFIALGGEVVHQLWNGLLPGIFGWRPITFWQALGLLVLCRILFGGFGGHGHHRPGFRRFGDHRGPLTQEDRERFREGVRERWGCVPRVRETRADEGAPESAPR